jgi:hypothetical protein
VIKEMRDIVFSLCLIGVFAGGLYTGIFGMAENKYNILQNKPFVLAKGNVKGHFISMGISFLSAFLIFFTK